MGILTPFGIRARYSLRKVGEGFRQRGVAGRGGTGRRRRRALLGGLSTPSALAQIPPTLKHGLGHLSEREVIRVAHLLALRASTTGVCGSLRAPHPIEKPMRRQPFQRGMHGLVRVSRNRRDALDRRVELAGSEIEKLLEHDLQHANAARHERAAFAALAMGEVVFLGELHNVIDEAQPARAGAVRDPGKHLRATIVDIITVAADPAIGSPVTLSGEFGRR